METIKRLHEAAKSMTFMVNHINSPPSLSSLRSHNTSSLSSIFSLKQEEASTSKGESSSISSVSNSSEVICTDSVSTSDQLIHRAQSYGSVSFRRACSNKIFCALCTIIIIEAAVLTDLTDSLHEMLANAQSLDQKVSSEDRNILLNQILDRYRKIIEIKIGLPFILIEADYSDAKTQLNHISSLLDEIHSIFYSTQTLNSTWGNVLSSLKESLCTTTSKGTIENDKYCSCCQPTSALYYPIAHTLDKDSSQLPRHDSSWNTLHLRFLSTLSPTIFHVPPSAPDNAVDGSNYSIRIEVLLGGIGQVNGMYSATYLDHVSNEASLHDRNTARISFYKMDSSSGRKVVNGVSITRFCVPIPAYVNIFVWAIIDSGGDILYIACTESAVVIPPLLGWHSTSRGRLPPPVMKLSGCSLIEDTGSEGAAENDISVADGSSPATECAPLRPLEISDFPSAVDLTYKKVDDSKVHHDCASADFSHIGARRIRSVKAPVDAFMNGPNREYFQISEANSIARSLRGAVRGSAESDDAVDETETAGEDSENFKMDLVTIRNRLTREIDDTNRRIKVKVDSDVDTYLALHQEQHVDNAMESTNLSCAENAAFEQSWSLDSLVDEYQRRDKSPKAGSSLLGMVKEIAKIGLASASAAYAQAADLLPVGESKGTTSPGKARLSPDGIDCEESFSDDEDKERLKHSTNLKDNSVDKNAPHNKEKEDDCLSAGSNSSQQAIHEEKMETQALFEDLCEVTLPQELLKSRFKCRVSLLGFELDCSKQMNATSSSAPAKDRLNYVMRIWLSNKRNVRSNKPAHCIDPSTFLCRDEELAGASNDITAVAPEPIVNCSGSPSPSTGQEGSGFVTSYSSILLSRSQKCTGLESWSVITIRRTFSSLLAFHNDLVDILHTLSESFQKSEDGSEGSNPEITDICPPPFVDAFLFGSTEEEIKQALLNLNQEPLKGLFNGTSNINAAVGGGTSTIYALYNEPRSAGMVLERTKSIDELMGSLQVYLEGVLSLVDEFDDTLCEWLRTMPPESVTAFFKVHQHAIHRLGRLIGRLLRAENSANEDFSPKYFDFLWDESNQFRRPFWFNYVNSSKRTKKTATRSGQLEEPAPSSPMMGVGAIQLSVILTGEKSGASDSRSMSSKSEIELLRTQRSRCLGCGESLYTLGNGLFGSFGIGSTYKNFAPCRYLGGLFCRRWCHRDDRRMIPYRMLQFWDGKLHRVSRPAALFLDQIKAQPILNIQQLNPLLFEGVPMLRNCYRLRVQITHLIDTICGGRKARNRPLPGTAAKLRSAICRSFGSLSRGHLSVTAELYSLEDLLQIQSGRLMPTLENILLALFSLMDGE